MAWVIQPYEGETHIVPDTDAEPHVLSLICWCHPVRDRQEPKMLVHRDALDRLGYERDA